jgi:hypothetical protein
VRPIDNGRAGSLEAVPATVVERLCSRREELVEAIFARFRRGLFDSVAGEDAVYLMGLRAAVAAGVDYALQGIGEEAGWLGSIPAEMSSQARHAARIGVSRDTVLSRYIAAHTLLEQFVVVEAAREEIPGLLWMLSSLLEHLLAAITSEYDDELERARRSPEWHRAECVRRLLTGGPVDASELHYEFEAWHVAVIASGPRAAEAVRSLAAGLDRQALIVRHNEESMWAWFGGRHRLACGDLERAVSAGGSAGVMLAAGESGRRLDGWRVTHRQAQAALLVALRGRERLTRYADVALLAAALRDDVLAGWLLETFLSPLDAQRDGGAALRETLRCYFSTGGNVSKVAVELGVKRQAVEQRREKVEQLLGRALSTCLAELEVALRLEELSSGKGKPQSNCA